MAEHPHIRVHRHEGGVHHAVKTNAVQDVQPASANANHTDSCLGNLDGFTILISFVCDHKPVEFGVAAVVGWEELAEILYDLRGPEQGQIYFHQD